MFASKTVTVHLLRGALGFGALGLALAISASTPWALAAALPIALLALRGCPMCWTLGLFETIAARVRGRTAPGACTDGSCAAGPRPAPPAKPDPTRDR